MHVSPSAALAQSLSCTCACVMKSIRQTGASALCIRHSTAMLQELLTDIAAVAKCHASVLCISHSVLSCLAHVTSVMTQVRTAGVHWNGNNKHCSLLLDVLGWQAAVQEIAGQEVQG